MTEHHHVSQEPTSFDDYLDGFLHAFAFLWWIPLTLTLLVGTISYYQANRMYKPVYTTEATVAVYSVLSDSSQYNETAQQLGKLFPYILTSGTLSKIVAKDLEMKSIPETIKVDNISGTNLLTITVSGRDSIMCFTPSSKTTQKSPNTLLDRLPWRWSRSQATQRTPTKAMPS